MAKNVIFATTRPFGCEEYDDSTTDVFEDDQPFMDGNAATHFFVITLTGCSRILLTKVIYYMNPTAAVTYTLYLLSDNVAAATTEARRLIYQSEAARADSVVYMETGYGGNKLPVQATLMDLSVIWFKLDWTGAPGNTTGFIRCEGLVYV